MLSAPSFAPRWASPPGDTIRDVLAERRITVEEFAGALGAPQVRVNALLEGDEPIDLVTARSLVRVVGGSTAFWMTRDAQYHDDRARLAADSWAESLPTKDMHALGWMPKTSDWLDRIEACLEFFGVPNVQSWESSYGNMLAGAKFRGSAMAKSSQPAVAAWMRQAEIQAAGLLHRPWNPVRFSGALPLIRQLSKEKDPKAFLPRLRQLCASAGVAVAVVRAPSGCSASGVARFLDDGRPLIALTGRYLSDDHFWFTFFHEAGHVLLHGPGEVYVDEFGEDVEEAKFGVEEEADQFAEEVLFPRTVRSMVPKGRLDRRALIRLAHEAGVSPGIVVGQLQFSKRLGYSEMNYLKRRYRWDGTSLEMA